MRFYGLATAFALTVLCWTGPASAVDQPPACEPGAWAELRAGLLERAGCVLANGKPVRFKALAVNVTDYQLGLRGSRPDGSLPTLDDVNAAESGGKLADYSLDHGLPEGELAAANVGYPEDERFFVASGLVRIAGRDVADRDNKAPFKSAMFCLNEAEYNQRGSRLIIFNAFERYRPIQLNERLRETNCLDVVQVGPRIVEYRGKEGIVAAEDKSAGQRYSVFAQGNGGTARNAGFLGYIFVFEDPINLYDVQSFLLSPGAGHIDTRMRVAVVLGTDKYAGMAWRGADGGLRKVGATSRPHPVFLTLKPSAPPP